MKLSQILVIFAIFACFFAQTKAVSIACQESCKRIVDACYDANRSRQVTYASRSQGKHSLIGISDSCAGVRNDCYVRCTF